MKTLFVALSLLSFSVLSTAQSQENHTIVMLSDYSSDITEIRDMLQFEGIDYYNIKFAGTELIGKDYSVVAKEIWEGVIKQTDTIVNTAKNDRMKRLSSDTLNLRVIAKKKADNQLKLRFRFPNFGTERTFEATNSDDYSLRDIGTQFAIEPNKTFYALAYILPYEKDGWKMYCAVDSSGKDVESWGKEFGIPHYLVFEMQFSD